MAGRALPLNSREMKAFVTYIHSLSKDVPIDGKVEGRRLPTFKAPDRRADVAAGSTVYQENCVTCHGVDGAGLRSRPAGSAAGYTYPPLWGNDSFNNGAGMNRLLTASAFIKVTMPLGTEHGNSPDRGGLTDDEAYDVAAFIVSQARPTEKNLDRDYPARWNKPVDCAFPPYGDGAPADQHKYGPFSSLQKKHGTAYPKIEKGADSDRAFPSSSHRPWQLSRDSQVTNVGPPGRECLRGGLSVVRTPSQVRRGKRVKRVRGPECGWLICD